MTPTINDISFNYKILFFLSGIYGIDYNWCQILRIKIIMLISPVMSEQGENAPPFNHCLKIITIIMEILISRYAFRNQAIF